MNIFKRIASLGRVSKPPLKKVLPDTWGHGHRTYPSRGLTPDGLSAIFAEADEGRTERQTELYAEMEEKDAHLGAVLQSRKLAASSLEWEVMPATEDADGRLVAEFAREALGQVENFDEGLAALMDAVAKGFSVVELVWEIRAGAALIRQLRPLAQGSFTFRAQGGLEGAPRLLSASAPVNGEPMMAGKFAVHKARGRAVPPYRAGVLRACAWMYLFKNYTLKDWVAFSERFAQPMRVGKYAPGSSDDDRRALKNAVFNIGADAAAIVSDSTVIELLESEGKRGSAEIYENLATYCDRAMSKAVLGQTLTTEHSGGSYAAAKVHDSVRQDIVEADARALARTVSSAMLKPLVEFNFGPEARLPGFRFLHDTAGDLKGLAETYATLHSMGISVPERKLRERFGISSEENLPKAAAEAPAGAGEVANA